MACDPELLSRNGYGMRNLGVHSHMQMQTWFSHQHGSGENAFSQLSEHSNNNNKINTK